jgi:AraC-like DNA-binding protein
MVRGPRATRLVRLGAVPKTIRHESELGRWEMVLAPPARSLWPYVRSYCGYDEETTAFSRRRELATTQPVLIVGFDAPIEVSFPDLGEKARAAAFVAGVSDRYAVVDSFGSQRGIQIDLTPLGAFILLRLPMHELANRVVELGDVLGAHAALLPERLDSVDGWAARFLALDKFFAARLADAPEPRPDIAWAWRRLWEAEGRLRVGDLAKELRCSRRHLSARFAEQFGLPPKTLARLLRFARAARLLGAGSLAQPAGDGTSGRLSLARIAVDCGYHDQAHLNRDFRQFAGLSPTQLETMLMPDSGGIAQRCSWPETRPESQVA